MKKRRMGCQFYLGILVGLMAAPLLLIIVLLIFSGTDPARQQAPAPPNQPDITVSMSRDYLEQSIATNPTFINPVLEFGPHPQGGAALTLTVGFDFPVVNVQDVHMRAQLLADDGGLQLNTEEARLGSNAQVPVPGDLLERALSTVVNQEIEKRLESSTMQIYIINVQAESEALRIHAIVPSEGE